MNECVPRSQNGQAGEVWTCWTTICDLMSASESPSWPHSSQVCRGPPPPAVAIPPPMAGPYLSAKNLSQLSSVRDCGLNLSNKYHNKNGASAAAHHSRCQPCSSLSSARYCWWDWVKAAAGCAASHRILAASRPLCSDPAPWWSHSSHRSSSCRRIW